MRSHPAIRVLVAAYLLSCGGKSDSTEPRVDPTKALAEASVGSADLSLKATRDKLFEARGAAPTDPLLMARSAELGGLAALLYGLPPADNEVWGPIDAGAPGWRDWAIGKAALELSKIKSAEQLQAVDGLLAELAKTDNNDPWRRWLQARSAILAGDRPGALKLLDGNDLAVARVEAAGLLLDDGKVDDATTRLDKLDHPLANVERAIVRAEAGDVAAAVNNLDKLPAELPPRLAAFKLLGNVQVGLANERYDLVAEALDKLGSTRNLPADCALWERIAWAHLQLGRGGDRGDHRAAVVARQKCAFFGGKATPNPTLLRTDAAIQLALGHPERTREIAAGIPTVWGRVLAAEAMLELGEPQQALAQVSIDVPAETPEQRRTAMLVLASRALTATASPAAKPSRTDLLAELDKVADTAKSQRARQLLGTTFYALGDLVAAKRELRRAVEETTPQSPDPAAYRTHALLAEIALAEADLATAAAEAARAQQIHGGNNSLKVLHAKVLVRQGQPDQALAALVSVRKDGDLSPVAALVVAEALVSVPSVSADQRAQARTLVTGLVGKVPAPELGRVAALVEPGLPARLKLPIGKLPAPKT